MVGGRQRGWGVLGPVLAGAIGCSTTEPPAPTPLEGHTLLVAVGEYDEGVIGIAAAARVGAFDVDDLYGAIVLQRGPIEAGELDVARFVGIPAPWDWGDAADWIALGDGLRVVGDDDEGTAACLTWLGAHGDFPVYVASSAAGFDDACAATEGAIASGRRYDLEVFGDPDESQGDGAVLLDAVQVPEPPTLEPILVEPGGALPIQWSGSGDAAVRIVVSDRYGNVVAADAVDDGELVIDAELVGALAPGPIIVEVARMLDTVATWSGADVVVRARVERRREVVLP